MLAIPTRTDAREEEITAEIKKSDCSVSRPVEPAAKKLRVPSSPCPRARILFNSAVSEKAKLTSGLLASLPNHLGELTHDGRRL